VELYNSGNGLQASPGLTGQAKDMPGLLDILEKKAPGMFGKMPGIVYVLEPESAPVPTPVPEDAVPKPEKPIIRTSFWIAIGLDVLGAAVIYAGYTKDEKMSEALNKYNEINQPYEHYKDAWKDVESNRSSRNTLYIIGGTLLASGVGVHIWF
jgi:hypothetical protein